MCVCVCIYIYIYVFLRNLMLAPGVEPEICCTTLDTCRVYRVQGQTKSAAACWASEKQNRFRFSQQTLVKICFPVREALAHGPVWVHG